MAKIKTRGDFEFLAPHTETYRTVSGMLNGKNVTVNFNEIEMHYNGTARVLVSGETSVVDKTTGITKKTPYQKYLKINTLKPIEGEETYFSFMERELEKLENKRKGQVKSIKKFVH